MRFHTIKILFVLLFATSNTASAQSYITYDVSFPNAAQHEVEIKVSFTKIAEGKFSFRMRNSVPGNQTLHAFAKNVYRIQATNSQGEALELTRPNMYTWDVKTHDGTVNVSYTLFGNQGDGTHSQINANHALLNMPATFIYAPSLLETPIQITLNPQKDWKVATPLKQIFENTYYASELASFMDSPIALGKHQIRSFEITSNETTQNVHLALNHLGSETILDRYFEAVKKIVTAQKIIFGEYPKFDQGDYFFLAYHLPHVVEDGMYHRNASVLTSSIPLAEEGSTSHLKNTSLQFFNAWNAARIQAKSVKQPNSETTEICGELWFSEGFSAYYSDLILTRAGLLSHDAYIMSLQNTFNTVWNSPGRSFFNAIEMSTRKSFEATNTSNANTNSENIHISPASYGSMLALALDLSLRNEEKDLTLDGYMQSIWKNYGKTETPFTIENLQQSLNAYAGELFGNYFFANFIYKNAMPNYKDLFQRVGIAVTRDSKEVFLGVPTSNGEVQNNAQIGSPAYKAGINRGDRILAINQQVVSSDRSVKAILSNFNIGDAVTIQFSRHGVLKSAIITLIKDPSYLIESYEKSGLEISPEVLQNRNNWLHKK